MRPWEPNRANLAILNWNTSSPNAYVNFNGVVNPNSAFRLMDPKNFFGTPLWQGTADASGGATVPAPNRFNLYIVLSGSSNFNIAPTVGVGANQNLRLPVNTVTLAGTVTDDGKPNPPGAVTYGWSLVSGPSATIANPSALTTTATLTTAGVYDFRLSADDSNKQSFADTYVTLSNSGSMDLWLPLDENSGTTANDSSGNAHNGTLNGSASWVAGKLASAVQFNGTSSYIQVGDFNLNSSFTLAFWFKPAAGSLNDAVYHYMFSWGPVESTNDVNVWLVGSQETVSGLALRVSTMDSTNTSAATILLQDPANIRLLDGNWHHFCVTVSSVTGRNVYYDGVLKSHDTNNGGHAINPSTNVFIGGRCDLDAARFYNGAMDDVRIYNVDLDANSVLALANPAASNVAPTITMPTNVTTSMPSAANAGAVALNATVSDDGLPTGSTVSVTWSVLSAPANGVVTFTNANAASTTANFTRVGTYQLQLLATDSNLTSTGTMTVTVGTDGRADFDKNGVVDGLDFLAWQRNYNHGTAASGAPITDANFSDPNYAKANGDANGDGKTDGQDFLIWQQGYMYCH